MPHFNKNTPGSKIHTTKGGGPCPHAKAKAPPGERATCNYKTLSGGFPYRPWQAHHVVCVEAVNYYSAMSTYAPYATKIDDCYKMTDWCINQKKNLLAMPHKPVYQNFPASRNMNIPCHDWDHTCTDGYFDEVLAALAEKVWSPIKKAVDTAQQNKTHFNEYAVLSKLEKLEKEFQQKLRKRGCRSKGTANGWANQRSVTNYWWLPFSMAKDSIAKQRKIFSF